MVAKQGWGPAFPLTRPVCCGSWLHGCSSWAAGRPCGPASRMPVLDAEDMPPGCLSLLSVLHWPHSVGISPCCSHSGDGELGQAGVRATHSNFMLGRLPSGYSAVLPQNGFLRTVLTVASPPTAWGLGDCQAHPSQPTLFVPGASPLW